MAYNAGDLAQTYPLARGAAPLMTAVGAIFLVHEIPGPIAVLGILLLSGGTLLMSLRGGLLGQLNGRAVGYALATSVFISGYTLVDGNGARLASTASSYAAWLFFCDGLCSMVIGFYYRGKGTPHRDRARVEDRPHGRRAECRILLDRHVGHDARPDRIRCGPARDLDRLRDDHLRLRDRRANDRLARDGRGLHRGGGHRAADGLALARQQGPE